MLLGYMPLQDLLVKACMEGVRFSSLWIWGVKSFGAGRELCDFWLRRLRRFGAWVLRMTCRYVRILG